MNIKSLSSTNLISELKNAVLEERKMTTRVLHLLREVEARRLYLESGYTSLFAFAVKFLGYSEAAAHRRISSMRAMRELPQLEEKILAGHLTLSNIAQVQVFLKQEAKTSSPISQEEKKKLFEEMEHKSARECEKLLLAKSPCTLPKEKRREITEEKTELKIVVAEETLKMLDRLKHLWAHKNATMADGELILEMAKFCLDNLDPLRKQVKCDMPKLQRKCANNRSTQQRAKNLTEESAKLRRTPTSEIRQTRYIPADVRRLVWHRDQGKCQYKDTNTGKTCLSTKFIQLDHKFPWSLGGKNTAENLQLLCSGHNRWRAAKTFLKSKNFMKL